MKAYVLHNIGNLKYEDIEIPKIKEDEVLVQVMAAGICGSDIPRIFKTGTYNFPTIPGHEFSGVISAVGKNLSKSLINKRVGVFPLIPCLKCTQCLNEKYELCQNYNYLGSRTNGGFAEFVAVPIRNIIEIPENVSFEKAAMLEPMNVALHSLMRIDSNLKNIKSAAVFGTGTIGVLILQWLKFFGVKNIFAIGTRDEQKALLNELCIDNFCNIKYSEPIDYIMEKTDGVGVDLSIECVGKACTINQSIEAVKPEGNVILVGNPEGNINIDKNIYWKILRKQINLTGTWNSSFIPGKIDDWKFSIEVLNKNKIDLKKQITHYLKFDELYNGLLIMRDKTEYYNKILIKF